jgi:regulator of nucleoside diphosphate kinase
VSHADYQTLTGLLDRLPERQRQTLDGLEGELARAEILPAEQMPEDIVKMGSTVVYEDVETGRQATVQLAYPEDAEIEHGRISILAPVGAALIGLEVGQEINWPLPTGRTGRLRVKRLIQPPTPRRA